MPVRMMKDVSVCWPAICCKWGSATTHPRGKGGARWTWSWRQSDCDGVCWHGLRRWHRTFVCSKL